MLQLNINCQMRVLEYINTRSDLKSLCLVSKELNQLALEKLYKRIDIRLYSRGNTQWVLENLEKVKENLQHTRELVVEDEETAEETQSVQYGAVGLPLLVNHVPYRYHKYPEPAERDSLLEKILDLIPVNALRIFRFLGRRGLAKSIHNELSFYQKNITDIQFCLYADPKLPNQLPVVIQRESLKRLDVHITEAPLTTLLLKTIDTMGRNLQYLSLSAEDCIGVSRLIAEDELFRRSPRRISLCSLKELRLTSLWLNIILPTLSRIIDFRRLSKLDLVACTESYQFLSDLVGIYRSGSDAEFALTHVAINALRSEDTIVGDEDERNESLHNFLRACPALCSLHFGSWDLDPLPPALKHHFESRGRELKLLSLYSESSQIYEDDFDFICASCPNLEQLSTGVDEELLVASMGYGNLSNFVNSIRRLQNLRTLHVQRPVITIVGGLGETRTLRPEILAMQMQQFANLMFGELYKNPDFNLETLIVGHVWPLLKGSRDFEDQDGNMDVDTYYLPQFCFARSRQLDILGRSATIGVPVSRALLRRTHDHTSILDVDAGVEPWEQWVGQAI